MLTRDQKYNLTRFGTVLFSPLVYFMGRDAGYSRTYSFLISAGIFVTGAIVASAYRPESGLMATTNGLQLGRGKVVSIPVTGRVRARYING